MVIGIISALLWIFVVSRMLVDLLNLYAIVFKLDQTFLGLTVLAVGGALPDAITTIALAKRGYG